MEIPIPAGLKGLFIAISQVSVFLFDEMWVVNVAL